MGSYGVQQALGRLSKSADATWVESRSADFECLTDVLGLLGELREQKEGALRVLAVGRRMQLRWLFSAAGCAVRHLDPDTHLKKQGLDGAIRRLARETAEAEGFDAVVVWDALHLSQNPLWTMVALANRLAPGGVLAVRAGSDPDDEASSPEDLPFLLDAIGLAVERAALLERDELKPFDQTLTLGQRLGEASRTVAGLFAPSLRSRSIGCYAAARRQ